MTTAFNKNITFDGAEIVKEAHRRVTQLQAEIVRHAAGRILLVDGACTLPAGYTIAATLKNVVKGICNYEPRMNDTPNERVYIVTFTFSPEFAIGDLIRIPEFDEQVSE